MGASARFRPQPSRAATARASPRPDDRRERDIRHHRRQRQRDELKLADLVAVFKAVPAAYRATSSWLIASDDFASLAGLTDTAGGLVLSSLQFDPPSLFGRLVYIDGYLPAPAAMMPARLGGDDSMANLITLCSVCHARAEPRSLAAADRYKDDPERGIFWGPPGLDGRPIRWSRHWHDWRREELARRNR